MFFTFFFGRIEEHWKPGCMVFLQNCARQKKGWSEPAATSAPVQHEAVQAVLGMKPKHIQVRHFCFPLPLPRVFSALFSAAKLSPPTYLPPPLLNISSFSLFILLTSITKASSELGKVETQGSLGKLEGKFFPSPFFYFVNIFFCCDEDINIIVIYEEFLHTFHMKICNSQTHSRVELLCSCILTI